MMSLLDKIRKKECKFKVSGNFCELHDDVCTEFLGIRKCTCKE